MNYLSIYAMNDLENWTPIMVKDMIKFDRWVLSNESMKEFFHYYDELQSSLTGGFDTIDRDILMDEVAIMLTGRPWPINMEGDEIMKSFTKTLKNALIDHEFLTWRK